MRALTTIIDDAIAVLCLTVFLLFIYVWATGISAFFYD
jgi:hypothetical protein